MQHQRNVGVSVPPNEENQNIKAYVIASSPQYYLQVCGRHNSSRNKAKSLHNDHRLQDGCGMDVRVEPPRQRTMKVTGFTSDTPQS